MRPKVSRRKKKKEKKQTKKKIEKITETKRSFFEKIKLTNF